VIRYTGCAFTGTLIIIIIIIKHWSLNFTSVYIVYVLWILLIFTLPHTHKTDCLKGMGFTAEIKEDSFYLTDSNKSKVRR